MIDVAIQDLAIDPDRLGSVDLSEIGDGLRTYHLFHSRKRAAKVGAKVRQPRHFLLVRVRGAILEIGRVLHDNMEVDQRIAEWQ